MVAKVKIDRKFLDRIKKRFSKEIPNLLRREIVEKSIKKGISPVKGQRKFKQYSESYKKAIRKRQIKGKNKFSPVNMTVTGDMLKSFFAKADGDKVRVGFKDPLAFIHNDLGASTKKVKRRLLPTKPKEEFNRSIFRNLRRKLIEIINKETR